MRGRSASRTDSHTASISAFTARASAVITGPFTERAISCTALKSPGEEQGNPASITSTFSRANWCASSSFSRPVRLAPGDCSPSRRVVSKMCTLCSMSHSRGWRATRSPPIAALGSRRSPEGRYGDSRAPHKCKKPFVSPTETKGHPFRGTTLLDRRSRARPPLPLRPLGRQRLPAYGGRDRPGLLPAFLAPVSAGNSRASSGGSCDAGFQRPGSLAVRTAALLLPFTVFRAYSFICVYYRHETPACQASCHCK